MVEHQRHHSLASVVGIPAGSMTMCSLSSRNNVDDGAGLLVAVVDLDRQVHSTVVRRVVLHMALVLDHQPNHQCQTMMIDRAESYLAAVVVVVDNYRQRHRGNHHYHHCSSWELVVFQCQMTDRDTAFVVVMAVVEASVGVADTFVAAAAAVVVVVDRYNRW